MAYICAVIYVKSILLSVLILFTFLGNVGLRVFTHSCEKDGVFRSYFVETQDHCENDRREVQTCCRKKSDFTDSIATEEDCCSDQVAVYKISLDYVSQYKIQWFQSDVIPIERITVFSFATASLLDYVAERDIDSPPKPGGKELLIRQQIFRI